MYGSNRNGRKGYSRPSQGKVRRSCRESQERRQFLLRSLAAAGKCRSDHLKPLFGPGTQGLPADAVAASLGCGNPPLAELHAGETVLDLGCGGGIDVLLSAKRVGPTGKAYGLDMTDEMLALARENHRKAGVENVEFLKGEIEQIPLPDRSVDVIISNCVVNLSGEKERVLAEAFRILRPGGRLALCDIVVRGAVPTEIRRNLELWAVASPVRSKRRNIENC